MLVGIGAMAATAEKSKEIVDDLVKKGELTVEQGKVLNEELRHTVAETIDPIKSVPKSGEGISSALGDLSPEELAAVKARIAEIETSAAVEADTDATAFAVEPENPAVDE